MKGNVVGLCMLLGAVMVSGCGTSRVKPVTSSGEKVHIDVLCDYGDKASLTADQWTQCNQVGAFMEPNLVRRLGDYGFDAVKVESVSEFKHQPDSYLLKVKVVKYTAGSSAARMLVGFGAGACSLDCHYDLVDSSDAVVLSWDDGCGTSSNWQRLPIKLNQNTGVKLSEYCTTAH